MAQFTAFLNSPGGHVRDAILIGNQVRYHSYSTRVPRRARCDSACVVIWLAGTHRELDAESQLGLHRVRKADKRAVDEERGNALVAKIMLEYGAPVAFVNLALATDPKSMSYVKYEKAKAWGLIDHTSTQTVRYQPGSEIWPLNMNKAPSFLRPQYPSLVKEASETHPAATTPAEPTPQPQQVNVETLAVRSAGDEERPQTKMPDTTLQKLLFGR